MKRCGKTALFFSFSAKYRFLIYFRGMFVKKVFRNSLQDMAADGGNREFLFKICSFSVPFLVGFAF